MEIRKKFIINFPVFWNLFRNLQDMEIDVYYNKDINEWILSDMHNNHQMLLKFFNDDIPIELPPQIGVVFVFWSPEDENYAMNIDVGCGITATGFSTLLNVLRDCKKKWNTEKMWLVPRYVN